MARAFPPSPSVTRSLREDAAVKRVFPLLAAAAALAGCSGDDESATTMRTTPPAPKRTSTFLVYLLRDGKVAAARRTIEHTGAVEAAAVRALIGGPTPAEAKAGLATGIPTDARLGSLSVVNGSARIALVLPDANEDEPSGRWAVAQVVYTLTQFSRVRGVVFGDTRVPGHGLTRADVEELAPAILVESPVIGDNVLNPVHVEGTANTFEATVQLRLEAGGMKLAERFVTATSGNGTRGRFEATIAAPAGISGPVTLVAYERSAATGQPVNVVRIPIRVQ